MMQGDDQESREAGRVATVRLTVTLNASDRAKLENIASQHDRSLGWVVRDALRQYLRTAQGLEVDGTEAE